MEYRYLPNIFFAILNTLLMLMLGYCTYKSVIEKLI